MSRATKWSSENKIGHSHRWAKGGPAGSLRRSGSRQSLIISAFAWEGRTTPNRAAISVVVLSVRGAPRAAILALVWVLLTRISYPGYTPR
jgi:hypothetical protein